METAAGMNKRSLMAKIVVGINKLYRDCRFERLPKPQTAGDILKQAQEYEVHEYHYGLVVERK